MSAPYQILNAFASASTNLFVSPTNSYIDNGIAKQSELDSNDLNTAFNVAFQNLDSLQRCLTVYQPLKYYRLGDKCYILWRQSNELNYRRFTFINESIAQNVPPIIDATEVDGVWQGGQVNEAYWIMDELEDYTKNYNSERRYSEGQKLYKPYSWTYRQLVDSFSYDNVTSVSIVSLEDDNQNVDIDNSMIRLRAQPTGVVRISSCVNATEIYKGLRIKFAKKLTVATGTMDDVIVPVGTTSYILPDCTYQCYGAKLQTFSVVIDAIYLACIGLDVILSQKHSGPCQTCVCPSFEYAGKHYTTTSWQEFSTSSNRYFYRTGHVKTLNADSLLAQGITEITVSADWYGFVSYNCSRTEFHCPDLNTIWVNSSGYSDYPAVSPFAYACYNNNGNYNYTSAFGIGINKPISIVYTSCAYCYYYSNSGQVAAVYCIE